MTALCWWSGNELRARFRNASESGDYIGRAWSAGVVDGSGLEMDRRRGANSSKLALHASRYHADEP
jgi:hypothetical protein